MDKLSGEFIRGYTKALRDLEGLLNDGLALDLKRHHKTFNVKTAKEYVRAIIKNREVIREYNDAFIRCEYDEKGKVVFKVFREQGNS